MTFYQQRRDTKMVSACFTIVKKWQKKACVFVCVNMIYTEDIIYCVGGCICLDRNIKETFPSKTFR